MRDIVYYSVSGPLEEVNMAKSVKKSARKAKKSARAKAVNEARPTIVLVDAEDAPQYYANHIEVSHNIHEFEMLFARLPAKVNAEQIQNIKNTGKIEVETSVRIIIPPSLMTDVIKVLQTQNEKYQEVASKIRDEEASEQ